MLAIFWFFCIMNAIEKLAIFEMVFNSGNRFKVFPKQDFWKWSHISVHTRISWKIYCPRKNMLADSNYMFISEITIWPFKKIPVSCNPKLLRKISHCCTKKKTVFPLSNRLISVLCMNNCFDWFDAWYHSMQSSHMHTILSLIWIGNLCMLMSM